MQPTPEDVLRTRLEGLRRSLELTDRVLSGRDVTLKFDLSPFASEPASSLGNKITVNVGTIKNLGSSSALVSILGLNYHEVAHVRYGVNPASLQSSLGKKAHTRFLEAYRIIEEARIETLLSTKYEKMKKYFAYPVVEFFVKNPNSWKTAFLYLHGRRYLPRKIRDTFRNIFEERHGKDATEAFADLIDQYRVLSFRRAQGRIDAAKIINNFAELLDLENFPHQETHDSERSKDGRSVPAEDTEADAEEAKEQTQQQDEKEEQGEDGSDFDEPEEEPEDDEDQEDESEEEEGEEDDGDTSDADDSDDVSDDGTGDLADDDEAEDQGSDDPGDEEPEDEPGEEGESDGSGDGEDHEEDPPSGDGERGDGDSAGSNDADAESDGGGGSSREDSDGLPEEDSSSADGSGVGSGDRANDPGEFVIEDAEELAEAMGEILAGVLDSDEVQQDIENCKGAMDDAASLSSLLDRHPMSDAKNLLPVTSEMLREADRLQEPLRQLWAMMEPGWEYGLSEGARIDMNRAVLARDADDYDSIYVDWNEGQQDNAGLEVVVLADESSSMGGIVPNPGENLNDVPYEARWDGSRRTRGQVVSKNVWELQYALQEIDAVVTVLTFSYNSRTLYDRNDRVTTKGYANLVPSGGTNPVEAIKEARRILTMSEMKNKMLVVISDGEWGFEKEITESLAAVEGAAKVAILIGEDRFRYEKDFNVVARTTGSVFEPMAEAVVKITERNFQQ